MATPVPSTSSGQVWEQVIRDDGDYAAPIDYCHINPLKHGYEPPSRTFGASG
jgi:REP element-mobilizing transposase RayT